MGRIKSALVKRTANQLYKAKTEVFNIDFENNKKALRKTMPSKKIRNKVAGQLTRMVRAKEKEKN